MARPRILFVTGKLAEPALRRLLAELAPRAEFDYDVAVLPITVAALATTEWVARHLHVPSGIDRVLLPGLCAGEAAVVGQRAGAPAEHGPKDLRDLPDFFGAGREPPISYGAYDIEILAEINHVANLRHDEILKIAEHYR